MIEGQSIKEKGKQRRSLLLERREEPILGRKKESQRVE